MGGAGLLPTARATSSATGSANNASEASAAVHRGTAPAALAKRSSTALPAAVAGHLPQRAPGNPLATVPVRPRPAFGPRYVSALDHGAAADGVTDDTAALRRTLAAAAGRRRHRVLAGRCLRVGRSCWAPQLSSWPALTRLVPAPHAGFGDRWPKAVLATPDDAAACVVLADLCLEPGNAGAVLLDWQSGSASSVFDVSFRIYAPVAVALRIRATVVEGLGQATTTRPRWSIPT